MDALEALETNRDALELDKTLEKQIEETRKRTEAYAKALEDSKAQASAAARQIEEQNMQFARSAEEKHATIEQLERELSAMARARASASQLLLSRSMDQSSLSLPTDASFSALATPSSGLPPRRAAQTPMSTSAELQNGELLREKSMRHSSGNGRRDQAVVGGGYPADAEADLRRDLERLTSAWKEAEAKFELRTRQLQEAEARFEAQRAEDSKLRSETRSLEVQLQTCKAELKLSQKNFQKVTARCEALEQQISAQLNREAHLDSRYEQLEELHHQLQHSHTKLAEENSALKQGLHLHYMKLEKVNNSREMLGRQVEKLETELHGITAPGDLSTLPAGGDTFQASFVSGPSLTLSPQREPTRRQPTNENDGKNTRDVLSTYLQKSYESLDNGWAQPASRSQERVSWSANVDDKYEHLQALLQQHAQTQDRIEGYLQGLQQERQHREQSLEQTLRRSVESIISQSLQSLSPMRRSKAAFTDDELSSVHDQPHPSSARVPSSNYTKIPNAKHTHTHAHEQPALRPGSGGRGGSKQQMKPTTSVRRSKSPVAPRPHSATGKVPLFSSFDSEAAASSARHQRPASASNQRGRPPRPPSSDRAARPISSRTPHSRHATPVSRPTSARTSSRPAATPRPVVSKTPVARTTKMTRRVVSSRGQSASPQRAHINPRPQSGKRTSSRSVRTQSPAAAPHRRQLHYH